MNTFNIDELKQELQRLNADEIEVIYSEDSINEYELEYGDEQTRDLNINLVVERLISLRDDVGIEVVWRVISDERNEFTLTNVRN